MALIKVEAIVTGKVWQINRKVGDRVDEGDEVLILESMKMEIPIEAPKGGVLKEVLVAEGDSVTEGQTLALVEV